jgi:glucose-6-phosphate 1-epimerase
MTFGTVAGTGNLSKVILTAADGARAEIYLHGAHVTSWLPAGASEDRLFLSRRSRFAAGAAIRGGIPVCFPQFATQGPLPSHGFARVMAWDLVRAEVQDDGGASAVLRLANSAATWLIWPHAFALELEIRLSGSSLEVALTVRNPGSSRFEFTVALHTYLHVADIATTTVHGLQGALYYDKVRRADDCRETAPDVRIDGAVDRVYRAAPQDLRIHEQGQSVAIRATGFPDTVVWNPGAEGVLALVDVEPGEEKGMLCVEAAAATTPVVLEAGATWRGTQALTAL